MLRRRIHLEPPLTWRAAPEPDGSSQNTKRKLLRTQEISVALHINPRNVGGEIRKTFIINAPISKIPSYIFVNSIQFKKNKKDTGIINPKKMLLNEYR